MNSQENRGITLIALIITIVILIILAGVVIFAITGDEGIINKSKEATENYDLAAIKEQIQIDIIGKQRKGDLTEEDLEEILGKYGTVTKDDEEKVKGVIPTKYPEREILLSELWDGTVIAGGTTPSPVPTGGGTPTPTPSGGGNGDWDVAKGVNSPDIQGGLTPIKWSETDFIETTANDSGWYDYIAQSTGTASGGTSKWANAKTSNGSMLVWIPRYEYKITSGEHGAGLSAGQAGTIDVNFISKNTTTPTSGYLIHPAFTNSRKWRIRRISRNMGR